MTKNTSRGECFLLHFSMYPFLAQKDGWLLPKEKANETKKKERFPGLELASANSNFTQAIFGLRSAFFVLFFVLQKKNIAINT